MVSSLTSDKKQKKKQSNIMIHEVEALFCKMSCQVEKLGFVHTKCQYQITVLGTDPVSKIGTILLHLNGRNFLIPYPRELVDLSF